MPRPGPRPYECVRRAWHSDRHQPLRGSLIQEIFRMANDIHGPTTKKNQEWQEKLPFVVLKAEEILYSKANSEAEYMDLTTLHDRTNDAIDTIIRKDDSIECGDLLQPCVEAALNLGCIPRRASRSQRHSNPGCYLSPVAKDVRSSAINADGIEHNLRNFLQSQPVEPCKPERSASQLQYWFTGAIKPTNAFSSSCNAAYNDANASSMHPSIFTDTNYDCPLPSKPSSVSCQENLPFLADKSSYLRQGRVYRLFYGANQPEQLSNQSLQISQKQSYGLATAPAMPFAHSHAMTKIGSMPNFIVTKSSISALEQDSEFMETLDEAAYSGCDLSLRLGPSFPTEVAGESAWTPEQEDVGSNSSFDRASFATFPL